MAIITSGPFVGYSGTIDGITYCQLPDGRTYSKRKNTPSSLPPSAEQLTVREDTGVVSQFVKPFENFISVSYRTEARKKYINTHNAMVSQIRKFALTGKSPKRKINLRKVLVSKGNLLSAKNTSAELTETGLSFKWSTETKDGLNHHSDQVMMLAYFPELKEVRCDTGGAKRRSGRDELSLESVKKKGYVAEVFISFITNDQTGVSNSVYLGRFIW
ncbi:hypothetical protein SAMN06265348_110162 [Pedobacter westerhofensis]|uniref:Uncharacterized protein n=1 Tax=Pedobacter westerhofensis TaxID=425512 RepID=A0A521F507_9SPHI|nr:DUF6266 family protein [Pedobacter westerhofensis]SMO91255.1 hypothetical protein SAMN06265348_110162 [Pedobacter westerhofensis]